MQNPNELRRYTNLLSLVHILTEKKLTLLTPERWQDQNDRATLLRIEKAMPETRVYALCMTEAPETFHHWQVFAGSDHGVCIVFHREALLRHLSRFPSIVAKPVSYAPLDGLDPAQFSELFDLAFVKRYGFRDELEFRVFAAAPALVAGPTLPVELPLQLIDRVIFSPFSPRPLAESMISALRLLEGCDGIRFARSLLTDNETWQANVEAIAVDLH